MVKSKVHATCCLLVFAALTSACASGGAVPRPFPNPGGVPPAAASAAPSHGATDGYAITGTALALKGTPYRNESVRV